MPQKSLVPAWTMTRPLAEMDVVYLVPPDQENEELRYSLRSVVANFPHRKIWLVGYQPPWLAGCEFIDGNKGATKEAKIYNNVLAAARHPDVSDQFVLFNDDFFVTAPVKKLPPKYLMSMRGHAADPHVANGYGGWVESIRGTLELLESLGIKNSLSYELHMPMAFDKATLAEIMAPYVSDHPPQHKTLYGNLARVGGTQTKDVKAVGRGRNRPLLKPFLSTHEASWPEYHARLDALFPTPTRYEQAAAAQLILATAIVRKLKERAGIA